MIFQVMKIVDILINRFSMSVEPSHCFPNRISRQRLSGRDELRGEGKERERKAEQEITSQNMDDMGSGCKAV